MLLFQIQEVFTITTVQFDVLCILIVIANSLKRPCGLIVQMESFRRYFIMLYLLLVFHKMIFQLFFALWDHSSERNLLIPLVSPSFKSDLSFESETIEYGKLIPLPSQTNFQPSRDLKRIWSGIKFFQILGHPKIANCHYFYTV